MKIKKVAVTDICFNKEFLKGLEKGSGLEFQFFDSPFYLKDFKDISAILTRTRLPINEELLKKMPNLKLIISATSGKNHIENEEAFKRRGVQIIFTGKVISTYIAEYTLLMMLQLHWKILKAIESVKKGRWREGLPLSESLSTKTLGIIGLGNIGREVVKKAKAFQMDVISYDSHAPSELFHSLGIKSVSLDELLKTSDTVTLHIPLNSETKYLIKERELKLMKPKSFLINTSRGDIVCEKSLVSALASGHLAGAGLDVFSQEPLPADSPLRDLDSVIMTPHFATYNVQAFRLLTEESFLQLKNFFAQD